MAGNRGDFEDKDPDLKRFCGSTGVTLDIPEIDLELKSETIVIKTRKLKAFGHLNWHKTLVTTTVLMFRNLINFYVI